MNGRVIDSLHHAAFELGYQGRVLRSVYENLPVDDPPFIEALAGRLDAAAFVVLDDGPYRAYSRKLRRVAGLYEMQAQLIADGKTLAVIPGSPEPFWVRLGDELDRLELLGSRALRGDRLLGAWFAVGSELAYLTANALGAVEEDAPAAPTADPFDKGEDDAGPDGAWDALFEAIRGLPFEDRMAVADELPIRRGSQHWLGACLADAYGAISACTARPDVGSVGRGGRDYGAPEGLNDGQAALYRDRGGATPTGAQAAPQSQGIGSWPGAGASPPLTECQADIATTIREENRRMTTGELLSAMDQAERTHGESTVKLALSHLVKREILTKCVHCRPQGYGLPGWGHSH